MSKSPKFSATKMLADVLNLLAMGEDGTITRSGEPKQDGYYVGGSVPGVVLADGESPLYYLPTVRWLVELALAAGCEVGVWTDSEDGKVYVDAPQWLHDKDVAVAIAQERGELAIWDVKGEREIRVGLIVNGEYVKMTREEN